MTKMIRDKFFQRIDIFPGLEKSSVRHKAMISAGPKNRGRLDTESKALTTGPPLVFLRIKNIIKPLNS